MLRAIHNFIFRKFRITTHRQLHAVKINYEKEIAELKAFHLEQLEQQLKGMRAIQKGLTVSIGLNCRRTQQLLQKEKSDSDAPYLESSLTFEDQLSQLRLLEPKAFDLWWQCFLNGKLSYSQEIEGNLSYGCHPGASAFNTFITPFMKGNVLDIGCGPQLLPTYLHGAAGTENVRLFGIDPLHAEHPFEFYRGFAEFLPWQSNCFDAVVCGTSLDHCLSLAQTLEEIKRVLKPNGKLLIWVGFVPGAKKYEPKADDLTALDEYHLFHFDRPWFESLMSSYFTLIKYVDYCNVSSFYIYEG